MNDARAYHEYYANWYRNDPHTITRVSRFYSELLHPYLPIDRGAKILDVGAGIGLLLRSLRQLGYESFQGVEVNAHQREGAEDFSAYIDVTDDSASWLDARRDHFDLICCLDVLEHVPKSEQSRLVQAMTRALRPGGRLLCTVPNANSAIASRWRYNDYTHENAFTEHSLTFVLRSAALERIQVMGTPVFQYSSGSFPRLKGALSQAARLAARARVRLDLIGELGFDEGRLIPLDVNLLGTGLRQAASVK